MYVLGLPSRAFVAVAALALSPMAHSEDECDILDQIAESTMEARQQGVPMIDLYKKASVHPDYVADPIKMVIDAAYKVPSAPTKNGKAQAVTDFRNEFYRGCLANQRKTDR